jgi:hypothetical protein
VLSVICVFWRCCELRLIAAGLGGDHGDDVIDGCGADRFTVVAVRCASDNDTAAGDAHSPVQEERAAALAISGWAGKSWCEAPTF